jgi:hypothetical protein
MADIDFGWAAQFPQTVLAASDTPALLRHARALASRPHRRLVLLLLLLLGGCAPPVRLAAVPRAEIEQAAVLDGVPKARFWADTQVPELAEEALRAIERERSQLGLGPHDRLPPASLHEASFDLVYMRALFDYGYWLARNGYP